MSASSQSTPPDPLDGEWFVHLSGKTYGPFSGHEIQKRILDGQVNGETLFYPKDGSNWIRAKSDPILGTLFERHDDTPQPKGSQIRYRRKIVIAAVLLICATIAWLASPYYALYDLATALREGDVTTLENRVDWESVRQGLRGDLNAALFQKATADSQTGETSALGAGFAVVLGPAIINNLVDGYVTPQAISKLALASKAETISSGGDGASPRPFLEKMMHDISRMDLSRIRYAFFSGGPRTFKIEVITDPLTDNDQSISLLLRWDSSWRLIRISLPNSLLDQLPNSKSDKKILSALKTPTQTASTTNTSEPQPIQIFLLEKGFKSANYRAQDYEDDITFVLSIKNVTAKDVRAFDGTLTFTDLLGNRILSSKLEINEVVGREATMNWHGSIKFNQFMDSHKRLRNEARDNLKITFATRKVLFTDGTVKDYGS